MSRALAIKGGDSGPSVVPGKPAESKLYTSTILPAGHDDIMPPKGDPLTKTQAEVLRKWIEQGAEWPESITLAQTKRIDFVKDIQPILELNCVACHRDTYDKGGLRMDEQIIVALFIEEEHGYIKTIRAVANPDKLRHLH